MPAEGGASGTYKLGGPPHTHMKWFTTCIQPVGNKEALDTDTNIGNCFLVPENDTSSVNLALG